MQLFPQDNTLAEAASFWLHPPFSLQALHLIFNTTICELPEIGQIEEFTLISDCTIYPAPDPIYDCQIDDLQIPLLRGAPGGKRPQGFQGFQGPQGFQGFQGP